MYLINLIIIFVYIMLAVISRKHYSKYKKKTGKNLLYCMWFSMGEIVYDILGKGLGYRDIDKNIRKCQVVSPGDLKEISKQYLVRQISFVLIIFFIFNMVSGVYSLKSILLKEEKNNVVLRDDYGGNEEEYKLQLEKDGNTYEFLLDVAPVEYSVEEVLQKVEEIYVWLEETIVGENPDLHHVSNDLYLPNSDEEKLFDITWDSNNPMLITSEGKIVRENVKDKDMVIFSAEITYMDYSFEKDFHLVLEVKSEDAMLREVEEILKGYEEESRYSKTFELPKDIQGVRVSMTVNDNNNYIKIMLLGIVLCVCILVVGWERLKEAGNKRDALLLRQYPAFVNKLYLLLWTGMTMKNTLSHYVSKTSSKEVLVREIEYTLNQINAGMAECDAYEELGKRLMLPEYVRLMNQISHNLKRGNSDLFKCMEKEVEMVLTNRKENAKKLGEEASTKLLLPMIILLIITMVIAIVPALFSF